MKNDGLSMSLVLLTTAFCFGMSSCGSDVGGSTGLFTVIAANDMQGLSVVTSGSNAEMIIPVIANDTIQQMVGLNHDLAGRSALPFDYDSAVTPWDSASGLSTHIAGGNPDFSSYPDAADMQGVVAASSDNDFNIPETVSLTYTPALDSHGVDWFSYQPLGIANNSDTAYVIIRYIKVTEDAYEPDDFIQFAQDITPYVTQNIGTHYIQSHNSDYPNRNRVDQNSYGDTFTGFGMSVAGDRDWYLIRIPANEDNLAIEVKSIAPKTGSFPDRGVFSDNAFNELAITLIEESQGIPPSRTSNGPTNFRYTQSFHIPLPQPYYSITGNDGIGPPLVQNMRDNFSRGGPPPLWFKWPLDAASGFLFTRRLFVRIHPRGSYRVLGQGYPNNIFEVYGDYRIDFRLLQKEF